ncbi:MAG: hypothetical protein KGI60_03705 [Patescibacteria group bacterium]|nr:hypothetical protein [Patescibacteria group bacterium]
MNLIAGALLFVCNHALAILILGVLAWGVPRATDFVLSCLYEVPVDQPIAVIKRRFGKIVEVYTGKGWIVLVPKMHTYAIVTQKMFQVDLVDLEVITPDEVSIKIDATLQMIPDTSKENVLRFFEAGQIDGVREHLIPVISQEIRQWASDPKEPPQTWQEAKGATDVLSERLKKKIVEHCQGVECPEKFGTLLPEYGVILRNTTIGKILPATDELRKQKERQAIEEEEQKGELVDTMTRIKQAKLLSDELGMPISEAVEIVYRNGQIISGHGGAFNVSGIGIIPALAAAKQALSGDDKSSGGKS